VLDRSYMS